MMTAEERRKLIMDKVLATPDLGEEEKQVVRAVLEEFFELIDAIKKLAGS